MPVIFLTASDDEYSTVAGLDMGAVDYIAKPFRARELVSRIRSALRRNAPAESILMAGDVKVDPSSGLVTKAGKELYLSALEYRLLLYFCAIRASSSPGSSFGMLSGIQRANMSQTMRSMSMSSGCGRRWKMTPLPPSSSSRCAALVTR